MHSTDLKRYWSYLVLTVTFQTPFIVWNFIFSPHLLWPLYRDAPSGLLFHHKLRTEPLPAQPLLNLLCLPLPSSFCMFFIFMFLVFLWRLFCSLSIINLHCITRGFVFPRFFYSHSGLWRLSVLNPRSSHCYCSHASSKASSNFCNLVQFLHLRPT